jgi:uncharacterized membrane protein YgcG
MAYCHKCGKHVVERMYTHLQHCQGATKSEKHFSTDDTASPMASSTWSTPDYASPVSTPDSSAAPDTFTGGGGESSGGGASGDW